MNIMLCVFLLVDIQSAMARRCLHECLAPPPDPVCSSIVCNGCCKQKEGLDSTGSCVQDCTGGFAGYRGTGFIAHDKMEVLCANKEESFATLCECLDACLDISVCRSVTYYNLEQRCYISTCDQNKNVYDSDDVPDFNVDVEDATLFIRSCATP